MQLHPQILTKNGKNEFVVLPWEEFVAIQEMIEDAQDLADLQEAVEEERHAPVIGIDELKHELGLK
jgi:hypothetical protein